MRAPFQALVIPFRRVASGLQFAVFHRRDLDMWQFVAGGGEDDETPLETAERETEEETGIAAAGSLMQLDAMTTIPKHWFDAADAWDNDLYVVPEHSFAVDVGSEEIRLSEEHTEVRWLSYEQARALLTWEANKNALWELNERLKKAAT